MTTTANSTPHRRTRWSDTLVVAAIAAGAVCSRVGISTADTGSTTTGSTTVTAADTAADTYQWTVTNYTDQPLTAGQFNREVLNNDGSPGPSSFATIGATAGSPALAVGQQVSGYQQVPTKPADGTPAPRTVISGQVCYAQKLWKMPETRMIRPVNTDWNWDHLYIFAMDDGNGGKKLMVTPENAHADVDMTTTGQSC